MAPNLEVQIDSQKAFHSGSLDSKKAVIQQLDPTQCRVQLVDTQEQIQIPAQYLKRSVPVKRDRVQVTSGEFSGQIGQLITVSDGEGVVRLQANADLKVFHMNDLAKFVGS